MRKLIVVGLLLFSFSEIFSQRESCKVYGSIAYVNSPYKADYSVYIEPETGMADLIVFKENQKLMADEEGMWYITESVNFADFRIFITDELNKADFTIEFVEERAFARCK